MRPATTSSEQGGGDAAGRVLVSVVVPVYGGEAYLSDLIDALEALRARWRSEGAPLALCETILVDDSAVDGSPALIDRLAREKPWVVALHLSRNYGQHAATIAGILHSAGDWVVTMDEDLQHPPERIPELLEAAVRDGADIVYAKPETAVHRAILRDWTSRGFKRFMRWMTGDPNLPNYNSFRLLRGQIARAAASVCGHDTYLDVNLSWFTQRVRTRPMTLEDLRFIRSGRSGYRFRTLLSHARRMLFSSYLRILSVSALFGFGVAMAAVAAALAIVLVKLLAPAWIAAVGWASVMVTLTFFGGVIVMMVGIALQYLSTLILRAHGKPTFFTIDRSRDAELLAYFETGPAPQAMSSASAA